MCSSFIAQIPTSSPNYKTGHPSRVPCLIIGEKVVVFAPYLAMFVVVAERRTVHFCVTMCNVEYAKVSFLLSKKPILVC